MPLFTHAPLEAPAAATKAGSAAVAGAGVSASGSGAESKFHTGVAEILASRAVTSENLRNIGLEVCACHQRFTMLWCWCVCLC